MRKVLDALYLGSGILAGCFLVAIFLLMMGLSLGREVGINIPSGDDFTAWSLVAMAFLGLAHTFKKGEMIRVGLLIERLKGRSRRMAEIVSLTIAAAFIGFFGWQAGRLTFDSWRFNDISQGAVAVPLWIPQLGFVVGLAVLLIAVIDELVTVLQGRPPSYEPPEESPDEFVERIASGGGV
ncbi:TRAP transporter small permease [Alsobacter sp. R-9]